MFRIGNGYDVHAFAPNRDLIVGGINIPHDKGLAGHSDADVLLHAIIDAVLGAMALGDIGQWFPDSDAQYAGISSAVLFDKVWQEANDRGYSLVNCDATIIAQEPKFAPFLLSIIAKIAELFKATSDMVNVKATTTERLGFCGRKEGIVACAVVLLRRK